MRDRARTSADEIAGLAATGDATVSPIDRHLAARPRRVEEAVASGGSAAAWLSAAALPAAPSAGEAQVGGAQHGAVDRHRSPRPLRAERAVELVLRGLDLLVLAVGAHAAQALTTGGTLPPGCVLMLVAVALLTLLVFPRARLYDSAGLLQAGAQPARLGLAWAGVLAGGVTVMVVAAPESLPQRQWLLAWFAIGLLGLSSTRLSVANWLSRARRSGRLAWNVVVIGSGVWGREAARRLQRTDGSVALVGYVDLPPASDGDDGDLDLRRLLTAAPVDQVALALDQDDLHRADHLLERLRDFPVEVGLLPASTPTAPPPLGHRRLGELTSVTWLRKPLEGWAWLGKEAFDRVGALAALVFLLPVLALIALVVKATSPGPILFVQRRLGFNSQPIDVLKFRTMFIERCDAPTATDVVPATRQDPRVTRVGRFLRRTSLDELPQLWNVLRGEMSLVGPRPHAVAHDDYYAALIDGYVGRHRAKPGITGWAQVNGCRGEIHGLEDMRRRLEFDLAYIDRWSFWFDVRILLKTLVVCVADKRAY